MVEQSELETIYREAQSALKGRDYVRAGELLRQILRTDENYKETSRLLARMVKLRRRRWYNHPLLWGIFGVTAVVILGAVFAPKIRGFLTSQIPATPTATAIPTKTSEPTKTLAPTPTFIPLAWKRIYIGQEFPRDNINVIVFDPKDPDVIYVGTQDAGIYKSIDGGLSWQPAHKGLGGAWVSSLVIDPQNPTTIYAGIAMGGGVYKTTDGGNNWYPINNGIDTNRASAFVSIVAISPQDSQRLYYSHALGLYTSTNGGDSWSEILTGGWDSTDCPRNIGRLAIDPTNPSRLLAFSYENPGENTICQEGVYKSSDGGHSWILTLQLEPMFGYHPTILAYDETWENVYATNQDTLYRSDDHGQSWQQLPAGDCSAFAVDSQNGSIAYCASKDKITLTRSGGIEWENLFDGMSNSQSIAVSPHTGQTVFAGGNGLWITIDGGKSWSTSNNGLGATHLALEFDPLDPSALLLEDEKCNIYRSTSDGRGWIPAPERTCRALTTLNASGEWLFWIDKDDRSLRRSNDKGATSQKLIWPIENEQPDIIVAHPTQANRILAVYGFTSPFVFVSDDNGETWRSAPSFGWDEFSSPGPSPRIFFDQQNGQRVYVIGIHGPEIFRSDDAGESWQACQNLSESFDAFLGIPGGRAGTIVHPNDADIIIQATHGNGIFISKDGCQSWRPLNNGLGSPFVNTLAYDPNNPDTVYAGTDGGAYVSFDFGQTWSQINDGLLGATVVYSIVVDKEGNVYAATPYGIFKLEGK